MSSQLSISEKTVLGQIPDGRFPKGLFPDEQFHENMSTTDSSPKDSLSNQNFAEPTLTPMNSSLNDISSNGHFSK